MRCINCGSTESFICGECYHIDIKKLKEKIEDLQKEIEDLKYYVENLSTP